MSSWILLRGLTREARHWGAFPGALLERTGARSVVALDLPGSGLRRAERSPATVEETVAECRRALEREGASGPWMLFALSLGAMVAASWASRFPGEVRGAVLVNTSMGGFGAWHERLHPRHYLRMLGMLCSSDAGRIERDVLAMTSRHPSIPAAELLASWTSWRRARPMARADVLRQLRAAAAFRAPETRPRVPMLLLASANDGLVDPACSVRMASAWGAPLAVHPTAGHDLPLDDPQWVLRETSTWFEREFRPIVAGGASAGAGG